MEVPAPFAGVVRELKVKVGDKLSEGSVVALIEAADAPRREAAKAAKARRAPAPPPQAPRAGASDAKPATRVEPVAVPRAPDRIAQQPRRAGAPRSTRSPASMPKPAAAHAAGRVRRRRRCCRTRCPTRVPAVRLFARELGVDLTQMQGSGRSGRIEKEDVQNFVKRALAGGGAPRAGAAPAGGGLNLLPWPHVDFTKFGEIETKPLTRIQKISGANLARNWAMIPHVTQHDDADITDLEALRVALNKENEKAGLKLTMLAFLMKASVVALQKFPNFNASLDASGENLDAQEVFPHRLRRRHAERPGRAGRARRRQEGRAADREGNRGARGQGARRQARARRDERRLLLDQLARRHRRHGVHADRQRAGSRDPRRVEVGDASRCGTASSSSRAWCCRCRCSYDHRVIDGAAAARFTAYLAQLLGDMRRATL